jgi:hypothetical protein
VYEKRTRQPPPYSFGTLVDRLAAACDLWQSTKSLSKAAVCTLVAGTTVSGALFVDAVTAASLSFVTDYTPSTDAWMGP